MPGQAHMASHYSGSTSFNSSATPSWYPDTGATHHVTPDLASLSISNEYTGNDGLLVGDGKSLPISHVGKSSLHTPYKTLQLKNILHVPSISKPLLSVQKLCRDNNCYFEFHPSSCVVKDQVTNETLLTGLTERGLYRLNGHLPSQIQNSAAAYLASLEKWHARLGHPNFNIVRQIVNQFQLPCSSKSLSSEKCEACCLGKLHRFTIFCYIY